MGVEVKEGLRWFVVVPVPEADNPRKEFDRRELIVSLSHSRLGEADRSSCASRVWCVPAAILRRSRVWGEGILVPTLLHSPPRRGDDVEEFRISDSFPG
jgi:hypothetical protein